MRGERGWRDCVSHQRKRQGRCLLRGVQEEEDTCSPAPSASRSPLALTLPAWEASGDQRGRGSRREGSLRAGGLVGKVGGVSGDIPKLVADGVCSGEAAFSLPGVRGWGKGS